MICRYTKDRAETDGLQIVMCGAEYDGSLALWGPGVRDVYILHYVLSGKGYFNGNPVKENQGFYIKANDIVHYKYDEEEPWHYFWIMFKGDQAERIAKKYIKTDESGIFNYSFTEKISEFIPELFSTGEFMMQSEAYALFYYIMSLHEHKANKSAGKLSSKENAYVVSAKNSIYLSIHQPTSISKIATDLGISDRYLYNLFIKHEGIAPKKYMNNIRLKNAKVLLENGDFTITEISEAVGFSDVMSFSSFFSKHVGMSPTEYKKSKNQ